MSSINEYVKDIAKNYPKTQKVSEQLEEIRDTLHSKTEEFMETGMGYEQAAREAIDAVGDLSELMNMVSGASRVVFVNRLAMKNALLSTIIIMIEIIAAFIIAFGIPALALYGPIYFPDSFEAMIDCMKTISFVNISLNGFWYIFVPVLVSIWIWPLISVIMYYKNPKKTQAVEISRSLLKMGIIGWGVISIGLFAVNMATGIEVVWFIWPVIGISNWPVNVYNYRRQLASGKFDV